MVGNKCGILNVKNFCSNTSSNAAVKFYEDNRTAKRQKTSAFFIDAITKYKILVNTLNIIHLVQIFTSVSYWKVCIKVDTFYASLHNPTNKILS